MEDLKAAIDKAAGWTSLPEHDRRYDWASGLCRTVYSVTGIVADPEARVHALRDVHNNIIVIPDGWAMLTTYAPKPEKPE